MLNSVSLGGVVLMCVKYKSRCVAKCEMSANLCFLLKINWKQF